MESGRNKVSIHGQEKKDWRENQGNLVKGRRNGLGSELAKETELAIGMGSIRAVMMEAECEMKK